MSTPQNRNVNMRQIAAIFSSRLLDDKKKILFKDLQDQAKGQKLFFQVRRGGKS